MIPAARPRSRRLSHRHIRVPNNNREFSPIRFDISPMKQFYEFLIERNLFRYLLFYKAIEELKAHNYSNYEDIVSKYNSYRIDAENGVNFYSFHFTSITQIRSSIQTGYHSQDEIDMQLAELEEGVFKILSDAWLLPAFQMRLLQGDPHLVDYCNDRDPVNGVSLKRLNAATLKLF